MINMIIVTFFCESKIVNFDICWLESIAWNSSVDFYIFVALEDIEITSYSVTIGKINISARDRYFGYRSKVVGMFVIPPSIFIFDIVPDPLMKLDGIPE